MRFSRRTRSGLGERCAPDRLPGYGGLRPPWGQSLLRSCLAAHSFPPPPPAYVLSALETRFAPIPGTREDSLDVSAAEGPSSGGGGGKECAARHERSNDWPQGARSAPLTRIKRLFLEVPCLVPVLPLVVGFLKL